MRTGAAIGWAVVAAASASVCACTYAPEELAIPAADPQVFRDEVYPILLADCGFAACHGAAERFLTVYGPGRSRLLADTGIYDPPTAAELAFSYTRARSMLISPDGVRRSPLLRKPLAADAGGAGHRGDDPWGNGVFPSKQDPRYVTLFYWAIGEEGPQ